MAREFRTVAELMDHDAASPMPTDDFDDALWLLTTERIQSLADLDDVPHEVAVYYASRLLQWDVENGGFAQAAFNIPEWFEAAAIGYAALGKPKAVRLISDALKMLKSEQRALKRKGLRDKPTLEGVFGHFKESQMAALDDRIPEDEWSIDRDRVAYVRRHRDAFRELR
jgi:hypothetical protein